MGLNPTNLGSFRPPTPREHANPHGLLRWEAGPPGGRRGRGGMAALGL